MKGRTVRIDLKYRGCELTVWGEWYNDDATLYIDTAHLGGDDGDFWPVIEDTPVGEELTDACEARLTAEAEARDEELRATGGLGCSYAEVA